MFRSLLDKLTPRYLVVQHDHVTSAIAPVARYYRHHAARSRALRETANQAREAAPRLQTRYSWEVDTRATI